MIYLKIKEIAEEKGISHMRAVPLRNVSEAAALRWLANQLGQ